MHSHSPTPSASSTPATWDLGDLTIHRIDEIALPPQTGPWLLPAATPDVVAQAPWLRPDFTDEAGILRLSSHSFAFSVDGLRVLVDTGIGNGKPRANPAWNNLDSDYLAHLEAAGFPPQSIDLVILTHLHTDHVGWNTYAEGDTWKPTFRNARYLTARTEWNHWAAVDMDEARQQMFRDSVHPIKDAGLLDLIDIPAEGTDIAPSIRLIPTPGHTPGHLAVELRGRTSTALITGDCIHHPVQLLDPTMGSCVDTDPDQATATRRHLLAALADTDTLLLGTHFPAPTGGLVRSDGDSFRLAPPLEPGPGHTPTAQA